MSSIVLFNNLTFSFKIESVFLIALFLSILLFILFKNFIFLEFNPLYFACISKEDLWFFMKVFSLFNFSLLFTTKSFLVKLTVTFLLIFFKLALSKYFSFFELFSLFSPLSSDNILEEFLLINSLFLSNLNWNILALLKYTFLLRIKLLLSFLSLLFSSFFSLLFSSLLSSFLSSLLSKRKISLFSSLLSFKKFFWDLVLFKKLSSLSSFLFVGISFSSLSGIKFSNKVLLLYKCIISGLSLLSNLFLLLFKSLSNSSSFLLILVKPLLKLLELFFSDIISTLSLLLLFLLFKLFILFFFVYSFLSLSLFSILEFFSSLLIKNLLTIFFSLVFVSFLFKSLLPI